MLSPPEFKPLFRHLSCSRTWSSNPDTQTIRDQKLTLLEVCAPPSLTAPARAWSPRDFRKEQDPLQPAVCDGWSPPNRSSRVLLCPQGCQHQAMVMGPGAAQRTAPAPCCLQGRSTRQPLASCPKPPATHRRAASAQLLPDREGYPRVSQYFGPVVLPGNQQGETEESIWWGDQLAGQNAQQIQALHGLVFFRITFTDFN